jgi:hypothetical protein
MNRHCVTGLATINSRRASSVVFVHIIACTTVCLQVEDSTCVELSVVLLTILDLMTYWCMRLYVENKDTRIFDFYSSTIDLNNQPILQ